MLSKTCSKCKIEKPRIEFGACSVDKSGLKSWCKACCSVVRKAHYVKNRAKEAARHVLYREKNLDDIRAKRRVYQAGWVKRNAERKRLMDVEYDRKKRAERDPLFLANNAERSKMRECKKMKATPPWIDREKLAAVYALAAEMTRATGVPHEVDHFYPLQGKLVSGLHVHTNLRVIPKRDNRLKSNRLIEA